MPTAPGRYSVRSGWPFPEYDLDWADSAMRYQGGALNWIGVCALAESLTLQAEIGADAIAQRVLELTDTLIERLDTLPVEVTSSRDPEHRSSYLTFTLGSIERDDALVEAGRKEHVFFGRRGGGIRVGTHFWNDTSDIDRLVALIETQHEVNRWPDGSGIRARTAGSGFRTRSSGTTSTRWWRSLRRTPTTWPGMATTSRRTGGLPGLFAVAIGKNGNKAVVSGEFGRDPLAPEPDYACRSLYELDRIARCARGNRRHDRRANAAGAAGAGRAAGAVRSGRGVRPGRGCDPACRAGCEACWGRSRSGRRSLGWPARRVLGQALGLAVRRPLRRFARDQGSGRDRAFAAGVRADRDRHRRGGEESRARSDRADGEQRLSRRGASGGSEGSRASPQFRQSEGLGVDRAGDRFSRAGGAAGRR